MNASLENDEEDDFYFESDHLALRGNNDYSEMLKTMFVLEAQRVQAIQDFNKVVDMKKFYEKNPLLFVSHSEANDLNLPKMLQVAELPIVDWSKYNTNVPEQYLNHINTLRTSNVINSKPISRNKSSWSPEEQRKLEELLIKYPSEDIERRRFIKIANELGNRTPEQVASRLQKYFQKLLLAGLPVPGRLPKSANRYSKSFNNKKSHGYYFRKYLKPSTFFPDTIIPVVMDDQNAPGPSSSQGYSNDMNSMENKLELAQSNYLLPNTYHLDKKAKIAKSAIDIEAGLLKWAKIEKLLETQDSLHQHYGYKCDYCDHEPLQGARWHCITCANDSVDFCTDCMLAQFYSMNSHDITHKFIIVRNDKQVNSGPWSDSESDSSSDESGRDSDESNDDLENDAELEHDNIGECKIESIKSESYTNGDS